MSNKGSRPNRAERRRPLQDAYKAAQEASGTHQQSNATTQIEAAAVPPIAGAQTNSAGGIDPLLGETMRAAPPTAPRSIWTLAWSWSVVGASFCTLFGAGVSVMTSANVWLADFFFVSAGVLFVAKFLSSKEACDSPMQRQLTIGCALLLMVAPIGTAHYINRPVRVVPTTIEATASVLPGAIATGTNAYGIEWMGAWVPVMVDFRNTGSIPAYDLSIRIKCENSILETGKREGSVPFEYRVDSLFTDMMLMSDKREMVPLKTIRTISRRGVIHCPRLLSGEKAALMLATTAEHKADRDHRKKPNYIRYQVTYNLVAGGTVNTVRTLEGEINIR